MSLPRLAPEQERIRLRQHLKKVRANVIVPVRHGPAAMLKAALGILFDYGRPASVMLAVLVRRGGRELPIAADATGLDLKQELDLDPTLQVKLTGPEPLALVLGHRYQTQ